MRLFILQFLTGLGALIYLSTQVLSYFSVINFAGVLSFWLGTGLLLAWQWQHIRPPAVNFSLQHFSLTEKVLLFATSGLILFLGIIALSFPPNNFDSMTYHMARIMHWMQHQNIEYFATHIERQNWAGPFAEYIIIHRYILTKSD